MANAGSTKTRMPILRLYSVLSPDEEPTRLGPTVIRRGEPGKTPPLVNRTIPRDFVSVDDVCEAYFAGRDKGWRTLVALAEGFRRNAVDAGRKTRPLHPAPCGTRDPSGVRLT
jgi:nucleoside-diphosphate-sugar epimerase